MTMIDSVDLFYSVRNTILSKLSMVYLFLIAYKTVIILSIVYICCSTCKYVPIDTIFLIIDRISIADYR